MSSKRYTCTLNSCKVNLTVRLNFRLRICLQNAALWTLNSWKVNLTVRLNFRLGMSSKRCTMYIEHLESEMCEIQL